MEAGRVAAGAPCKQSQSTKLQQGLDADGWFALVKTLPSFARRPYVIASMLTVVVTTCVVASSGGVSTVGVISTEAGGVTALPGTSAMVVGLTVTMTVGSIAWRWRWHLSQKAMNASTTCNGASAWNDAAYPLIFDISSADSTGIKVAHAADAEVHHENVENDGGLDVQAIRRTRKDPFKGNRQRLLAAARKRTASWVALLLRGCDVRANGANVTMKLQGPPWQKLDVGSDSVSLVSTAFRLDGDSLRLVAEEAAGEKVIFIEFEEASWALELALALKVLRAEADTGGGVCAWEERPADDLRRPAPVE